MKQEIAKMIEEKAEFIRAVEAMLIKDQRNNSVDCIDYKINIQSDDGNCYDEYIDIIYTKGQVRRILVTGNSNGANLKAIAKEVY